MVISLWVSRISRHEISHQFASLIATAYHFFLSVSLSLNLVYIYICSDVGYPISWNFSRCLQRFPSWTLFSFTSDNSMSRFDQILPRFFNAFPLFLRRQRRRRRRRFFLSYIYIRRIHYRWTICIRKKSLAESLSFIVFK